MSKLIIRNSTTLHDAEALQLCLAVVQMGLISETHCGRQYCFHSTITQDGQKYEVSVKKMPSGTQTFYVYQRGG